MEVKCTPDTREFTPPELPNNLVTRVVQLLTYVDETRPPVVGHVRHHSGLFREILKPRCRIRRRGMQFAILYRHLRRVCRPAGLCSRANCKEGQPWALLAKVLARDLQVAGGCSTSSRERMR